MKLNFLGRGAAFNPKEGSTAAFILEDDKLLLIDCGESVFGKLKSLGVLEKVREITVMFTHTHSDHIGSLGSLAMFSYYGLSKQLKIIVNGLYQQGTIIGIMNGFGCTHKMMHPYYAENWKSDFKCIEKVEFIKTNHCDDLECYGIKIHTKDRYNLLFGRYERNNTD